MEPTKELGDKPRKGGKPKKKQWNKCPKDKPKFEVTNDASWYLRDGIPRFSGEFDDLQKIGDVDRVFPNGINLDTSFLHGCALAPPVDDEGSFFKQMATLLSKVRVKNTGANIYTIDTMMVYIWKLIIAHATFASIAQEINAVSYVMPGNADAPWVALNMQNSDLDWEAEAQILADTRNEADIVGKMLDALPVPDMAMLDRVYLMFGQTFADSKGGKPSFSVFKPFKLADLSIVGGVVTPVYRDGWDNTISKELKVVRDILADIYNDTGGNFTMLRGDLKKFWEPKPRALTRLYAGYKINPMSAELSSQLENASLLGRKNGYSAGDFAVTYSAGKFTLTLPCSGILNAAIESKAELGEQPINARMGQPKDGELMAITALMPLAEQVNGTTSSKWNVTAHNGIVLWETYALTLAGINSVAAFGLGDQLDDTHSSVQSTMRSAYTKLQWVSSIMAHSPMFITDMVDPMGYIWDVDFVGIITASSLRTAITRVVRSLFQVNLPERKPY